MRMVKGLANEHAGRILAARMEGAFPSVEDVWRRSGVPVAALERLAEADAFASLGLDRRQALWRVRGLGEKALPLFAAIEAQASEPEVALRPMTDGREVVEDYRSVQLSLRRTRSSSCGRALRNAASSPVRNLRASRTGAASTCPVSSSSPAAGTTNVTFITIEDETGIANIILWQRRFEAQRRIVMGAPMIGVTGIVQREGDVIHVIGEQLEDQTGLLHSVGQMEFVHRTGPATAPGTAATTRAKSGGTWSTPATCSTRPSATVPRPCGRLRNAPRPKVRNSF
jgi:error-prone DNA polymerase